MSCVSIVTPVTVSKVEWFTGAGTVYTDDSPTPVKETGEYFNLVTLVTLVTVVTLVTLVTQVTSDQWHQSQGILSTFSEV